MSDEALLSSVRDVLDELPRNANVAPKFMVATWQMWARQVCILFNMFWLAHLMLTCWVAVFDVQILLNVWMCVCDATKLNERAPGPVHPQKW